MLKVGGGEVVLAKVAKSSSCLSEDGGNVEEIMEDSVSHAFIVFGHRKFSQFEYRWNQILQSRFNTFDEIYGRGASAGDETCRTRAEEYLFGAFFAVEENVAWVRVQCMAHAREDCSSSLFDGRKGSDALNTIQKAASSEVGALYKLRMRQSDWAKHQGCTNRRET